MRGWAEQLAISGVIGTVVAAGVLLATFASVRSLPVGVPASSQILLSHKDHVQVDYSVRALSGTWVRVYDLVRPQMRRGGGGPALAEVMPLADIRTIRAIASRLESRTSAGRTFGRRFHQSGGYTVVIHGPPMLECAWVFESTATPTANTLAVEQTLANADWRPRATVVRSAANFALFAGLCAFAAWWVLSGLAWVRELLRARRGLCPTCGYDCSTIGRSRRCPECGRAWT